MFHIFFSVFFFAVVAIRRHHAKKGEAAGFCYVNDGVLAVLHLAKAFGTVLTIDIGVYEEIGPCFVSSWIFRVGAEPRFQRNGCGCHAK